MHNESDFAWKLIIFSCVGGQNLEIYKENDEESSNYNQHELIHRFN